MGKSNSIRKENISSCYIYRKKIVKLIAYILHAHRKRINSLNGWTMRIPVLARTMECLLFYNAPSFEEYKNMSTFSRRLDAVITGFIAKNNNSSTVKENMNLNIAELSHLFNSAL